MEKLVQEAQALFNVHLTGRQVTALIKYEKELLEWNQKFNLTAIRDTESIRTKHFSIRSRASLHGKFHRRTILLMLAQAQGFPAFP